MMTRIRRLPDDAAWLGVRHRQPDGRATSSGSWLIRRLLSPSSRPCGQPTTKRSAWAAGGGGDRLCGLHIRASGCCEMVSSASGRAILALSRHNCATVSGALMFPAATCRDARQGTTGCPAADPWKSRMQDRENPKLRSVVHCQSAPSRSARPYQEERLPIPLTNGRGYICWQCYASVRRQTARRAAEQHAPDTALR